MTGRPQREMDVASECVPNIGLRGRRRRVLLGFVWVCITGAAFAALLARHASTPAFLAIAPLALLTAIYFFQAKEKT